jgi:hypothetical protein
MKIVRAVMVLAVAATLASCNEAPTEIQAISGSTAAHQDALILSERSAQVLARGIALALRDPDMRALVRDAMRESPYVRHKLVLQDFVNTNRGFRLLAAVATQLHQSPEDLGQQIQLMPALDFYVPVQRHRRTWLATDDILVGAAFFRTGETTVELVGVDGRRHTVPRKGAVPDAPVIMLHPAQLHAVRGVQRASGKTGLTASMDASSGCDATMAIEQCDESGAIYAVTDYAVTHGVYITHFNPQHTDGWFGDDELRWIFSFWKATEELYGYNQVVEVLREQEPFVGSDEVIFVSARPCDPANPPRFTVSIAELSGGFWTDDDWGTYRYPPYEYGGITPMWNGGNLEMYLRIECR